MTYDGHWIKVHRPAAGQRSLTIHQTPWDGIFFSHKCFRISTFVSTLCEKAVTRIGRMLPEMSRELQRIDSHYTPLINRGKYNQTFGASQQPPKFADRKNIERVSQDAIKRIPREQAVNQTQER